jgi:hypothetical protein
LPNSGLPLAGSGGAFVGGRAVTLPTAWTTSATTNALPASVTLGDEVRFGKKKKAQKADKTKAADTAEAPPAAPPAPPTPPPVNRGSQWDIAKRTGLVWGGMAMKTVVPFSMIFLPAVSGGCLGMLFALVTLPVPAVMGAIGDRMLRSVDTDRDKLDNVSRLAHTLGRIHLGKLDQEPEKLDELTKEINQVAQDSIKFGLVARLSGLTRFLPILGGAALTNIEKNLANTKVTRALLGRLASRMALLEKSGNRFSKGLASVAGANEGNIWQGTLKHGQMLFTISILENATRVLRAVTAKLPGPLRLAAEGLPLLAMGATSGSLLMDLQQLGWELMSDLHARPEHQEDASADASAPVSAPASSSEPDGKGSEPESPPSSKRAKFA